MTTPIESYRITKKNEVEALRDKALTWLESMHVQEGPVGQYRLNQGAEPTIFASCFALYLQHLLGNLEKLDTQTRLAWLSRLQEVQDPASGLFVDPKNINRSTDQYHDEEHLNRQLTTFCLSAIGILEGKPLYPLNFLETWKDSDNLVQWLEQLEWTNSWNCGNKVMFMGIFLICDWEQTGDPRAKQALDVWFDWHDRHQNPETGFWGTGRRAAFMDGLGGAYHQYVIYNYMERPLNYAEQIIDRTLFLQQPDGMYSPHQGGAACNDLDAVDVLVHLYNQHDYRRDDIEAALRWVLTGLLSNQNSDGGFCWGRHRPYSLTGYGRLAASIFRHRSFFYWYLNWRSAIRIQTLPRPQLQTGWAKQPRYCSESSIFDTWFRCLTIAEISQVLTDIPYADFKWNFLRTPGLGWFSQ